MKKYGLPKVKAHLLAPKMKLPKKGWEEVFEDEILWNLGCWYLHHKIEGLSELLMKYLYEDEENQKVKIKCKKGCIQIEKE